MNVMYFSNPFGITSIHVRIFKLIELNDCHNLLNHEILQELFKLTEDLCYKSNELHL